MQLSTLCYIEKEDAYLMLHRIKKEVDINKGKWIGVGGKFERDESPEECLLREVEEETGLILLSWELRGIITFLADSWTTEYIFLYTADKFKGQLTECEEGILKWIPRNQVEELNIWEGDKIFLRLLQERRSFFSLKLQYSGDDLIYGALDGEIITHTE